MEPRAYSRDPVGSQFIVFSYAHQTGDVLTDAALPLRDVNIDLNAGSFAYGRTFGIAGRQASIVNGLVNADKQANSRIGGTFALPLTQKQSLKVAFANGLTTRFGGDVTTVAVGWQYAWVD